MTKYQFQIDDEKWREWKNTVPRSKSLEKRIVELIEADTEGRVIDEKPHDEQKEPETVQPRQPAPPKEIDEERATGDEQRTDVELPDEIDDDVQRAVDDVAESWDDDPDRLEHRRQAAATVLQHAAATGDEIGKSHPIVDAVQGLYPVEGQNPETYWRKNIRPVLQAVGEYSRGTHAYTVESL